MSKVIGELKARLGLDKSKYEAGLKGAEKSSNKFVSLIKKIGGVLAAAFAVRKIIQFGKQLLGVTDIQAKAEQSLLVALKGRRDIQQSLIKQAGELQKKTLYGDEQTIEGAAKLAMLLGQDEKAISRLLPLVQDLATAKFGGNLVTAADMVAKSVGSSTNALTRYGIEITGAVGSSERLETAIAGMNKQVGGQAEAAAKVGTGAITQLKNMWGDYKEYLGSKLLPVMNKVAEWGKNFVTKLAPKQSEVLRQEQADVNNLVGAITNENISREARESLMKKLQSKYPDFLENLNIEKTTNEDLRDRLREVNDEYENRIKLAVQQELVNKYAKEYADSIEKEAELVGKLTKYEAILADDTGKWNKDQLKAVQAQATFTERKIKNEQDLRQGINDKIAESIELLDIYKEKVEEIPTGGGGIVGGGKPAPIKLPVITSGAPAVTGLFGITEEDLAGLKRAEEQVDAMIAGLEELDFESRLTGGVMQVVFAGVSDAIADSMFIAGDSLKAFGDFFADFVKHLITRLIAATIAAAALAVVLSVLTGGKTITKGLFAGMKTFKDFFGEGFNLFSGFDVFASGGVVPIGYSNDTYPAMLSSHERVLTPAENRAYESGMSNSMDVYFHGDLKGTNIVWLVDEIKRRNKRCM